MTEAAELTTVKWLELRSPRRATSTSTTTATAAQKDATAAGQKLVICKQ
jgi:hypothetical protein